MNIMQLPRNVLRWEYQLVRFPLTLVEQRLSRLPDRAPARLVFERSVGLLDAAVGGALGDQDLRRQGAALAERSSARGRAAGLRASATAQRKVADAKLKDELDQAAEDQSQALATEQHAVGRARASEEQRKRDAEEGARERTSAAERQADETAARRQESVEAAKREDLDRIRTAERKVAAEAATTLEDARTKRAAAQGTRAQADRVEALADAEKRKRQAARSAAKS